MPGQGKLAMNPQSSRQWDPDTSPAGTVSFKSTAYSFWLKHTKNIPCIRFAAVAVPPYPAEGPSTSILESRAWQSKDWGKQSPPGLQAVTLLGNWRVPGALLSVWADLGFFKLLLLVLLPGSSRTGHGQAQDMAPLL